MEVVSRLAKAVVNRLPASLSDRYQNWRMRRKVWTVGSGEATMTYTLRSFDKHECIFIRVPKAASQSVSYALFGHAAGGHRTASDYREIFGSKFDDYFVFSFVRNPFERLVSAYEFLMRGGHPAWPGDAKYRDNVLAQYDTFSAFVAEELENASRERIHFQPQTDFLCVNGKIAVDFIGRVETIEDDFQYVCKRLGIETCLRERNTTGGERPPLNEYYSSERLTRQVRDVYRDDFDLLNYDLSVPSEPLT